MAALLHPKTKSSLPATACLFLIPLCLLLLSCTTSLYPLAEKESEAVFRPGLTGNWEYHDNYDRSCVVRVNIEKVAGNGYRIRTSGSYFYTGGEKPPDTNYLLAKLIPVGDYWFLDCVADTKHPSTTAVDEYTHLGRLSIHYIFLIQLRNQDEVAELWHLQAGEEPRKILRQKKASFYAQSDETLLLMEPSARLKKLLVDLAREDAPGVWEKALLIRADPGAEEPARVGSAAKPAR